VRYLVLGPLEVHGDSGLIALGSPKERRLLAVLLSRRGEVASADALIDAIWDGTPLRSAAKTLQGYVVHLRHALEGSGTSPHVPSGLSMRRIGPRLTSGRCVRTAEPCTV